MKETIYAAVLAAIGTMGLINPAWSAALQASDQQFHAAAGAAANSLPIPGQILRTGINLNATHLSPNSVQLADMLGLTPALQRIQALRSKENGASTDDRIILMQSEMDALAIINECALAADFTITEINAETQIYSELASNWQNQANKVVQYSNWGSYYSNGALWSIAEAFTIPSWKRPKYAISSGTVGIIAGAVPSVFSLYAMHSAGGKKHPGEGAPNMLAKMFDQQTNSEVEFPDIVWTWLNAAPPAESPGKTRRQQLIDRWVADSNIPGFTDPKSQMQTKALSGTSTDKKALTISLMQTRVVMLSQLSAEIAKMKRMLLELSMAARGQKQV